MQRSFTAYPNLDMLGLRNLGKRRRERYLRVVSEFARRRPLVKMAVYFRVSRTLLYQMVAACNYSSSGYSAKDSRRRYAQYRRLQYDLLCEYPATFKSIIEEPNENV